MQARRGRTRWQHGRCRGCGMVGALGALILLAPAAACGSGDDAEAGPGGSAVVTAGSGTAGPADGPGGNTANGPPDDTAVEEPTATTGEAPPPTAGGGEAGIRTDPGGNQIIVLPECGTINVTDRLDRGEFVVLRSELQCVFGNADTVPADVLAAARVADAYAAARLAEQEGILVDDEVREVLEDPPPDLPPAFDDLRDEGRQIAEEVAEEVAETQESG